MRFAHLFICLVLMLGIPSAAHGQSTSLLENSITDIVTLTALPNIPGPNERVSVSVSGSGLDLDSATITWTANGVRVASGKGIKRVSVETGNIGSETVVSVTIAAPQGTVTRSLTLRPSTVDILWQGEGYTPPFYKAKNLWGHQGRITILAIPHIVRGGTRLDPNTLIYRWSRDGEVVGNSSGAGRNSFVFTDSILSKPVRIKVDILTDWDTVVASEEMTLDTVSQKVLMYEDNPLLGLTLHQAIGNTYRLRAREVTFASIPLFFTGKARDISLIVYEWRNNANISSTESTVTYRLPEGSEGTSRASVSVRSRDNILQGANKNFLIEFNNETNAF